jgi:hypothetical protein
MALYICDDACCIEGAVPYPRLLPAVHCTIDSLTVCMVGSRSMCHRCMINNSRCAHKCVQFANSSQTPLFSVQPLCLSHRAGDGGSWRTQGRLYCSHEAFESVVGAPVGGGSGERCRAASLCERQLPQGIALQLMPRQLRTKIQTLAVRIYYIDCDWAGLTGLSLPKFPTAPC